MKFDFEDTETHTRQTEVPTAQQKYLREDLDQSVNVSPLLVENLHRPYYLYPV